eukprot:3323878-Pyramimonas_sp.AAC.1
MREFRGGRPLQVAPSSLAGAVGSRSLGGGRPGWGGARAGPQQTPGRGAPPRGRLPSQGAWAGVAFGDQSSEDIEAHRAGARGLAVVVGATATAGPPGATVPRWIVSDPGSPDFGKECDVQVAANPERL